jgi:hypothetical protein
MGLRRSQLLQMAGGFGLSLGLPSSALAVSQGVADPLPSWRPGNLKQAIVNFVHRVCSLGSPHYIPPVDRIATFDNDGTLWCEQPLVQAMFILDYLKTQIANYPDLASKPMVADLLEFNQIGLSDRQTATDSLLRVALWVTGNMAQAQFLEAVNRFFATAIHPHYGLAYGRLVYQPQLELLNYLQAHGFQTWLCSAGDVDLVRQISWPIYGIPAQQVIGSALEKEYRQVDGGFEIWRRPVVDLINDQRGKPVGIERAIGKPPVLACGNVGSGGDIAMLTYSQSSPYDSLQLLVNHDDQDREFVYGEADNASLLAAQQQGWQVISMQKEWLSIFPQG